jgi:RecB family exonuclease
LAQSVQGFFSAQAVSAGSEEPSPSLESSAPYEPPKPREDAALPQRLRITALRDYLQCPYRFYLRHVLRVEPLASPPPELDAALFGVMAHEVLQRFAQSERRDSSDEQAIATLLLGELDGLARRQLGGDHPPAVRVQLHQLHRRLERFAQWQAETVRAGWRIEPGWIERLVQTDLELDDGRKAVLVGRIDRVDVHPSFGVRVIDYKTGDQPRNPKNVHWRRERWVDLQLPLYRLLVGREGLAERPELGYYALSKKLGADPWLPAAWSDDEFADALAVARQTATAILDRRFWPPSEPPAYPDGYEWICGDGLPAPDRVSPRGAQ